MLQQAIVSVSYPLTVFPGGIKVIGLDIDDCVAEGSMEAIRDVWLPIFARRYGLTAEDARTINASYIPTYGCSALGFATENGRKHPRRSVNRLYASTGKATAARYAELHQPSGIDVVIASLHAKGMRFMPITLGHPTHADDVMAHEGILSYMETGLYRVDKSKHWVYHRALRMAGVKPHEMLMIDDSPGNHVAAAQIGIHTMMVGPRDPGRHAPSIHFRFSRAKAGLEALNRQYA